MADVVVDIYRDASGGLTVWPPIVFLSRLPAPGDRLLWRNHSNTLVRVRDISPAPFLNAPPTPAPPGVVLGAGELCAIPAAAAAGPATPGGPCSLVAGVARGTYKYRVRSDAGEWARGSESAVD